MASLKIQVLGKGLIPRGLGIAPRKAPFHADLTLIQTILNTPGLKVRMVHPETGQFMNVTNTTVQRLWEKYSNAEVVNPTNRKSNNSNRPNLKPVTPAQVQQPTVQKPVVQSQIPPAAAAIVKEAVNQAADEIFGKNDPAKPEEPKVEPPKVELPAEEKKDEKKDGSVMVKPFNPEDKSKKK